MRVTIIGGGGFRVPLLHAALSASRLDVSEIALYDVEPARLRVIESVLRDPRVMTTTDLDEALDGTTVVFSAIRPGGTAGRVVDERRALDLGVLGQETVGAGGLAYAWRTAPVVLEQAARIASLAPEAWTITMTNPAGIVTEVMARVLGDRVLGVCDSPSGLVRRACAALQLPVADVEVDYLGLNHLGWLRGLRIGGVDRLPDLLGSDALLGRVEEGRLFGADLLRALGALPNEYLYWYYAARESLAGVIAAGRTRAEHVAAEQARFYATAGQDPAAASMLWRAANEERNRSYFAELREGERDEADVAAGGYETVAIGLAEALLGAGEARLIVDVRNGDAVPGLPADAAVELACAVDATGAHPLPLAPPTTHQLGLMSTVKACEQAIVEGALTGSREAALRAFALHPLVPSVEAARALVAALP